MNDSEPLTSHQSAPEATAPVSALHILSRPLLRYTGWIEISFTTCTQRFFLEPSFKARYTYYGYSAPEPLSWQYSSTVVNNSLK